MAGWVAECTEVGGSADITPLQPSCAEYQRETTAFGDEAQTNPTLTFTHHSSGQNFIDKTESGVGHMAGSLRLWD